MKNEETKPEKISGAITGVYSERPDEIGGEVEQPKKSKNKENKGKKSENEKGK